MIDGDLMAAVDIGVDEVLVEDVDVGRRSAPCASAELDQTRVQQKLNLLGGRGLELLPFQEIGGVILLQRPQHGAQRGLAPTIASIEERVLAVLTTGDAASAEAPHRLDTDDLLQEHCAPQRQACLILSQDRDTLTD